MKIFNKNEWKKVKLGDVFDLQMGKTPLRENKLYWDKGEYHWISISDMNFSEKYISSTKEKITELAVKKSGIKIIPKNTVIMSFKLSIGKVKIVNEDIYSNEAIMAFIPKTNNFIDENFLYYSLKGVRWNEGINKAVKGLTLNKALISQKEIFLPNLAIQKEIASNLDSIADFLDLRRKQLNYLEELSKSLFTTMFGDIKTNDKNWEIDKFNEIISILTDYHANGSYKVLKNNVELLDFKEYALMIRTTDLENDNFIQGVKYINEKAYNFLKKTKIFGGEIIINKIGSAGNVYLMPILNRPVSLGMNQFMIRLKEDYNNIFYYKLLKTDHYSNIIKNNVQGAVTKTITKDAIKNIDVIIPPIELQNKFAERIEKIEKLKFEIEKSIEVAQNLYDSLISKYFDN